MYFPDRGCVRTRGCVCTLRTLYVYATGYHQSENNVANYNHCIQAHLIWCTLVHKWLKIKPLFQPTQNLLFPTLISLVQLLNGNYSWKFYN